LWYDNEKKWLSKFIAAVKSRLHHKKDQQTQEEPEENPESQETYKVVAVPKNDLIAGQ
jgi:hypothetical protein